MKQRLALNNGRPPSQSYRPLSFFGAHGSPWERPCFMPNAVSSHLLFFVLGNSMVQRYGRRVSQLFGVSHRFREGTTCTCAVQSVVRGALSKPVAHSASLTWYWRIPYKGREVRWNSVWHWTMASRPANLTDQSVFFGAHGSPWERPCFMPNAVSSHLPSFVLIRFFRYKSIRVKKSKNHWHNEKKDQDQAVS